MTLLIVLVVALYLVHALLPPALDYVLKGKFVEGLMARDTPPPSSLTSQRARRALNNMNEGMLMFMPIALLVAMNDGPTMGAMVFLIARIIYLPAYLLGVPVLRSAVWFIGLMGIALMAFGLIFGS